MLSKLQNSKVSQENLIVYISILSGLFCLVLLIYHFLLDNFAAPGQYTSSIPEWNADRLSMAFFLKYKFNLYNPQDSVGPLISDMYGPLLALAYLPASIANSPTVALIIGKLISLLFFFTPVIWLYVSEAWHQRKLSLSILALIAFVFFTTNLRPLYYDAFRICADCPALGFSALACVMIYQEKNEIPVSKLLISAILAVLAVWTKQIALPILISLPVYVFLAYNIKIFKRYLACLVISGLVISSILILAFNPQDLLFNMITIPGNQPWNDADHKILVVLSAVKQLAGYCLLQGTIVGFWILFTVPHEFKKIKTWIQENPWLLFVIVSLFFIPTSILGRVKVGGDANGMYTVYFLTIAAILVLLRQALSSTIASDKSTLQSSFIGQTWLISMVIMFTIYNINLPIPYIYQTSANFLHNVHQVVYEYDKKHPGQVYFPWHPLSVLMAENKLYHIDSGPFDRYLAGFPISKEDFMDYLPENFTMIAVPTWADQRGELGKFYLHYLPDFDRQIEVPELSGFVVYTNELEE